jgi:polar amino acid transport system substrate-binding protein
VLAQRHADGRLSGVTVDLSQEIGRRLGVSVELTGFDAAAKTVAALASGAFDIGFLAVDPERADVIEFTAPYVLIEGAYIVRNDAPFQTPADVDVKGVRVGVSKGAAYDLHLSRALKNAELVRYSTSAEVFDGFLRDGLEAGANIRQPAAAFAARHGGLRVLTEPFMQIRQAVAIPRGRGPVRQWVDDQLVELKSIGFFTEALNRAGQRDAIVAP